MPCQVYLSVRNGAWFVRRVWDNGLPLDLALFRRSTNYLVHLLPSRFVSSKVREQVNSRFDHAVYGLKPSHGVLTSPAVTNDDLPSRVLCGSVQVRPGVARLTSSAVHFTDATHVDHVDAVICGTGWSECVLFNSDHNKGHRVVRCACLFVCPLSETTCQTLPVVGGHHTQTETSNLVGGCLCWNHFGLYFIDAELVFQVTGGVA